ncbi:MAG: hypothetical protein A2Z38_04920 [Planctomycetes bacterium RBG_19FT_COMBO_48_8]|nr:MAG: hypothetical protein A2Z38_04920 [Planctomycetes bacterium RBG_19FT_COMBO_48_8]
MILGLELKMKIKYVQLESDAFLTDIDFVQFTPGERGVYCSLILLLTSNDGKCTFDPRVLSRNCNCDCVEEFEKIFQRIAKKFQLRNGIIRHKRVTKELKKAKHFRQLCAEAGLKGANRRWGGHSHPNGVAIAKETKGNVNVKVSKDLTNTNTADQSACTSDSLRSGLATGEQLSALRFNDALSRIIPPRSRSDRTCFRNVTNWLAEGCACGRYTGEIFERVLDYAKQARQGKKPAAVFMSILKDELGYEKKCKR